MFEAVAVFVIYATGALRYRSVEVVVHRNAKVEVEVHAGDISGEGPFLTSTSAGCTKHEQ